MRIHQQRGVITMPKRALAVLALSTFAILIACGSDDDTTTPPKSTVVHFQVSLSPSGEPPGLLGNPTGTGSFTATLDTATNVFTYSGTFSGLTSNVNNGH